MKPEDKRLFEELLVYREDIFYICLGFTKNPCDAEELTQDVFLKAFEKIETLRNTQLAKMWLLKICRDYAKKIRIRNLLWKPKGSYSTKLNTPESQIILNQQIKSVKESIQRLPKKLREVFILREYGDLSYRELAVTLGVKEGTVMSRLNRARREIMDMVKGELE